MFDLCRSCSTSKNQDVEIEDFYQTNLDALFLQPDNLTKIKLSFKEVDISQLILLVYIQLNARTVDLLLMSNVNNSSEAAAFYVGFKRERLSNSLGNR